ncbi:aldose epimerase family protein [Agathobaculum desmolans]|uniref:aldose epimerase family protein n=1 Tax=Agathobaculum desmolans TaxID=39484 RepID=UPI0004E0E18A|nr:aldose epimerase family protein [Agathobaculum desmolans]
MNITCTPFGKTADGRPVERYVLTDGPYQAAILSLGGIVQSLVVPDRHGVPTDVVLGFDTVADYEAQDCYIGALLGRCANRLAEGRIEIGGQAVQLACNDNGVNQLHGGNVGFDKRIWQAYMLPDGLRLCYDSPAGEEAFPGRLRAEVTYRLQAGALTIEYRAESDAETVCNLSNHSYFNLAGHDTGEVGAQQVCVHAARYTPLNDHNVPTGEIAPVEGTPLDLRAAAPLRAGWDSGFAQIALAAGYDHNYIIDGEGLRPFAEAYCAESGIALTVESDMPGMQLYTGNFLRPDLPKGKGGAAYDRRHAFCMETQFWPNAFACPGFPLPLLRAGEVYQHITTFRFSCR